MPEKNIENCVANPRIFNICEFISSMFLVIAAISPIILFIEVFKVHIALAVIANAIAVGFVLFALIEIFGPICTAYFNPVVSFCMALNKEISWFKALQYSFWQIAGGLTGMILTHLMFYDKISKLVFISNIERTGGTYVAEGLGTFILILGILSLSHQKSDKVSLVVGLLVGGMLLSTSSTMFANPQVTIARVFTYSDAGIRPIDASIFIIIQFIAGIIAFIVWKYCKKGCKI